MRGSRSRMSAGTATRGGVWVIVAVAKAVAPTGLVEYIANVVPRSMAAPLAWGIVLGEFLLGAALLVASRSGRARRWCQVSLFFVSCFAALLIIDKHAQSCGCLGAIASRSHGRRVAVLGVLGLLSSLGAFPASTRRVVEAPKPREQV